MTDSEMCHFIQDDKELASRGLVCFPGPRDNRTDCESDRVITHIPTGLRKRFHGTFYDKQYVIDMYEWIIKFDKIDVILAKSIHSVKVAQRESSWFREEKTDDCRQV